MKDTVRQGEISESIFESICFQKYGYMVSWPRGTSDYDCIVDVNRKLLKVQIKSSKKGDCNFNICKGTNGIGTKGKYPYPLDSIDFFAVHDIMNDEWYMIPREFTGDVKNLRMALKRKGKYTKFKNNWSFAEEL